MDDMRSDVHVAILLAGGVAVWMLYNGCREEVSERIHPLPSVTRRLQADPDKKQDAWATC